MAFEDMVASVPETDPAVVANADPSQEHYESETPEPELEADGAETPEAELPTEPAEEYTMDGRSIPQSVRGIFKNPEGGKEVKAAWMERAAFREAFPDGPKQAKELLAELDELGGTTGLDGLRSSAAELKQIDAALQAGDTKILDRVAQQSPDAIGKLAPEFMAKWGQIDPDGCNRTLCGVIANTFNQSIGDTGANLVMNLRFASQLMKLGQTEEAAKLLDGVSNWTQTFGQIASQPPTQKPAPPPEIDTWKKDLETREYRMFDSNVRQSADANRNAIIERELKPFLKGATLSPDKRQLLDQAVLAKEQELMEADKAFVGKFNAYRAGKNEQGASAAHRNKQNVVLPAAVQQIARAIVGRVTPPKPVAPPAPKPAQPQRPAPQSTPAASKDAFLDSIFG